MNDTGLKYTWFLPTRYVFLKVYESGQVRAVDRDGTKRIPTPDEVLELMSGRTGEQFRLFQR